MELSEAIKIMEYNKYILGLPEQGNTWRENGNTIACDLAIELMQNKLDAPDPDWERDRD
jgi:hypothetical protein